MDCFAFFFGVELGRVVLNMADNLSAALQGSTVSASEGQSLMQMTVTTLQSIRSDDFFAMFWKTVEKKRQQCGVDEPNLHQDSEKLQGDMKWDPLFQMHRVR